ncbi:MAG TPA: ubiquinone/menaquinone biosynthesis methyltransferase [Vicinamibacterales bacterium]|nr:ubiquinone/menaquinone biosynthesis methyltransferase [Vicinamibacterales bacterium]
MSGLRAALAEPHTKAPYVRRLFHTIADRYDLITRLLSFGADRRWKLRLAALADLRSGTTALDLACGTGDIACELARRGARVFGLDLTHRMLQLAQQKNEGPRPVRFVTGDMMALPFADASFDLVTTGYGIRNVPLIEPALAEIRRVLRPGGLLLSLDFDRPANRLVRAVYLGYLTIVGSALGWVLHRDPDTYRYIPESIRRYPGSAGVSAMLARGGFSDARVVPLLGGLMAINVARRASERR